MNHEPFEQLIVDGIDIPLQRYPHIGRKIALLWGTQECLNYMFQLLDNTDRSPRKKDPLGFDTGTAEVLMSLIKIHPSNTELREYRQGHYLWKETDNAEL